MDRQSDCTLLEKLKAIVVVSMFAVSINGHANTIKIHVHDANNDRPLQDISVCLGTTANNNQFGAVRTDAQGNATFSTAFSKTPLLLTVSGSQHKGVQRMLPTGGVDLVRTIDLPAGGLGPVCDAPPTIVNIKSVNSAKHNKIKIVDIQLDRGFETTTSRSVVLNSTISGKPSHYRISEDPEFKDSNWQAYQRTPLFTLSKGDGRKQVYFQVRRSTGLDSSSIETRSNVASDWITLETR